MRKNLTTIWLALAFILACKELARRSGVASSDWGKELRRRAFDKLNRLSDQQLAEYIGANLNLND